MLGSYNLYSTSTVPTPFLSAEILISDVSLSTMPLLPLITHLPELKSLNMGRAFTVII